MGNRFLERQLASAESKKLGRTECFYEYDAKTDRVNEGQRAADQAKSPRMVTAEMYPVGRPNGVAKPGTEATIGRTRKGGGMYAVTATPRRKNRK